jgi:dihydrofolate reductase
MWVHGHAIVGADARMTDAAGRMPEVLRFEADWVRFQAALDRADVALIGRRTHEAAPNVARRARVVVTGNPTCSLGDDRALAFDPAAGELATLLTARFGPAAHVAVVGGTDVFELAGRALGYDAFDLTVAPAARLDGGRSVFEGALDLAALAHRLERLGLARTATRTLAAPVPLRAEAWRRRRRP